MARENRSHNARSNMRNEAAAADNLVHGPFRMADLHHPKPAKPRFWILWGIRIGVLMAAPQSPKGWGWNPSVITLCIVIGGLLAGGGYYIGYQARQIEHIEKRSDEATRDVKMVKDLVMSEEANSAVPSPTPTPKKEKK